MALICDRVIVISLAGNGGRERNVQVDQYMPFQTESPEHPASVIGCVVTHIITHTCQG